MFGWLSLSPLLMLQVLIITQYHLRKHPPSSPTSQGALALLLTCFLDSRVTLPFLTVYPRHGYHSQRSHVTLGARSGTAQKADTDSSSCGTQLILIMLTDPDFHPREKPALWEDSPAEKLAHFSCVSVFLLIRWSALVFCSYLTEESIILDSQFQATGACAHDFQSVVRQNTAVGRNVLQEVTCRSTRKPAENSWDSRGMSQTPRLYC